MEIECKNCRYHYDFKNYGERCPNCYFENKPFRSQSARKLMGYEDDSLRGYFLNHDRAERREALLRSGDPDYGKSPLRRLRKYLFLMVLCFAVLLLGQSMTRLSYAFRAAQADPVEKPPVSSLAAASYHKAFYPVDGVTLTVQYTGTVPDEKLGKGQKGKRLCVFVDIRGSVQGDPPKTFPGTLFVRADGRRYTVEDPLRDGADMGQYSGFNMRELREYKNTAGQLFFYLPLDTKEFTFCWLNGDTDTEQRMELHV